MFLYGELTEVPRNLWIKLALPCEQFVSAAVADEFGTHKPSLEGEDSDENGALLHSTNHCLSPRRPGVLDSFWTARLCFSEVFA